MHTPCSVYIDKYYPICDVYIYVHISEVMVINTLHGRFYILNSLVVKMTMTLLQNNIRGKIEPKIPFTIIYCSPWCIYIHHVLWCSTQEWWRFHLMNWENKEIVAFITVFSWYLIIHESLIAYSSLICSACGEECFKLEFSSLHGMMYLYEGRGYIHIHIYRVKSEFILDCYLSFL